MNRKPNALIGETSPYLLQHAYNPVDWMPWKGETLQLAKQLNKPILVSIGYAACHWCHVMERESFEDEKVAAFMNEHFINIKVDREERPDIDQIYMDAVQAMTGSGGWPLNAFLTPDGRPFYGGTYFPPVRLYNRSSWTEILQAIQKAWVERAVDIDQQATQLLQHLQQANQIGQDHQDGLQWQQPARLREIWEKLAAAHDEEEGGFSGAPKFPQTFSILNCLQLSQQLQEPAALTAAVRSLDKMAAGGIYDQIGGGFARYSTDAFWLAPHFEKMLYDQALLITAYAAGYRLTQKQRYATVIQQTIAFLDRELLSPEGLYYSALDADSEGVEGKFYVWTYDEIQSLAGENFPLIATYYECLPEGNWEGHTILRQINPVEKIAIQFKLSVQEVEAIVRDFDARALQQRALRVRPGLDDKCIMSWNALLLHSFCEAAGALQDDQLKEKAKTLAAAMQLHFKQTNPIGYWHVFKAGGKINAFLDDLAAYARALIALQSITGNNSYLMEAAEVARYTITNFAEENTSLFAYTSRLQTDVLLRKRDVYDGATPSGNSLFAAALWQLGILMDNADWKQRAIQMLNSVAGGVVRHPVSFGLWANLLLNNIAGIWEIAIVGKNYQEHLKALLALPFFNKVVQAATTASDEFPLLKNKIGHETSVIYACQQYTCRQPVNSIADLMTQISGKKEVVTQ